MRVYFAYIMTVIIPYLLDPENVDGIVESSRTLSNYSKLSAVREAIREDHGTCVFVICH